MSLIQMPLTREVRVHVTPKNEAGDGMSPPKPARWHSVTPDIVEVVDVEPTRGLVATLVPWSAGEGIVQCMRDYEDGAGGVSVPLAEFAVHVVAEDVPFIAHDVTTEPSKARRD